MIWLKKCVCVCSLPSTHWLLLSTLEKLSITVDNPIFYDWEMDNPIFYDWESFIEIPWWCRKRVGDYSELCRHYFWCNGRKIRELEGSIKTLKQELGDVEKEILDFTGDRFADAGLADTGPDPGGIALEPDSRFFFTVEEVLIGGIALEPESRFFFTVEEVLIFGMDSLFE